MPNIGFWATAGAGGGAGGAAAMELISTTLVASTTQNITFSSIDTTTYKHLQIRLTARDSGAYTGSSLILTANGLGGSSYAYHRLSGNGSSVTSGNASSTSFIYAIPDITAGNSTASAFGAGVIDILDAGSTTKYKTVRTLTGVHASSPVGVHLTSGLVMTTSAITSLNITHLGSGIATGSRFSLYGIKG